MEGRVLIDSERLVNTFLDLVRIDSPSGHEEAIGRDLTARLATMGLTVTQDKAGNLIGRHAGADAKSRVPPLLLSAHMDTVGTDTGIRPVIKDGIIRSDGTTILGADDKSGVAIILEVIQAVAENGLACPPLEVVLTVSEERSLVGAKALDLDKIRAQEGIVLDMGGPIGTVVVSAPYQDKLFATVHGRAAHAGAEPERGINAIRVASEGVTAMSLGRIDDETTANVGVIHGGQATNIVPDEVVLHCEARSHSEAKLAAQMEAMRAALEKAAVRHETTVDLKQERSYDGYSLSAETPIVKKAAAAIRSLDLTPLLLPSGGGSDACIYNAGGIATINLSTGMDQVHTVDERIAVDDMVRCAELLLQILTLEA
jgi:tripeptide aminopeptidase